MKSVEFLSALFGPRSQENVFITRLPNVKGGSGHPKRVTRQADSVHDFVTKYDAPGYAIYFCVSTLKPGAVWRDKKNISEIVCLHADLDFKGIVETRESAPSAHGISRRLRRNRSSDASTDI